MKYDRRYLRQQLPEIVCKNKKQVNAVCKKLDEMDYKKCKHERGGLIVSVFKVEYGVYEFNEVDYTQLSAEDFLNDK